MNRFLFVVICLALLGCSDSAPVKFKLTMIYPDGSKRVFIGHSVHRDNSSGDWSYCKLETNGCAKTYTFRGKVECEPILALDEAPPVATYAEAMPGIKQ